MRVFPLVAAAFLAFVLPSSPACSGPGSALPDPPDLSDPIEANLIIAALTCERAHACEEEYPYATAFPFELAFGDSPAACIEEHTKQGEDLAWMPDSIAEGRLRFHPDRAVACWIALQTDDCPLFWMDQGGDPCDTMFEGLVADHEPCADDLECIDDRCDPLSDLCRSRD